MKGDADTICKAAEKYDSVFVMIIGSTEDVILTGERSALRKPVEELGYVANELNVANYIHTPVVAHLADAFRQGLMATDLRLAAEAGGVLGGYTLDRPGRVRERF